MLCINVRLAFVCYYETRRACPINRDKLGNLGGDREAREVTRWIAKGYEVAPVVDEVI